MREQFGHDVTVFDTNPTSVQSARDLGFRTLGSLSVEPPAPFDMVLGCSGYPVLNPRLHVHLLKADTLMISASSGNHELGFDLLAKAWADNLTSTHGVTCINPDSLTSPGRVHDTVVFETQARRLHYLNGGFPLTFIGRPHAVPTDNIAPTIVLMVAGAMQAAEAVRERAVARRKGDSGAQWLGIQSLNPVVDAWVTARAPAHTFIQEASPQ